MDTIRIYMEYGCSPIRIYENGLEVISDTFPAVFIDNGLIRELSIDIEEEYNGLFINDAKMFKYKGFNSENDKAVFLEKLDRLISMVKSVAGDKYVVIDEVDRNL